MKYAKISDQTKLAFIEKVLKGTCTIKQAAKQFGIKFSTAKAILSLYKHEGRVGKKQKRIRRIQKQVEDNQQRETAKTLKEEATDQVDEVKEPLNGQNYSQQQNYSIPSFFNYQNYYSANLWMYQMCYQSFMNYYKQ